MGCLYLLIALISPRLLIVLLWLFTDYIGVFKLWVWPLIGLIFMPWLTLAVTWAYNDEFGPLQIAAIVVAALLDFGSHGGAEHQRRRRAES